MISKIMQLKAFLFSFFSTRQEINRLSPRGIGVEHWPCNPRVSGSISGTGNLKKLFIRMKIHGLTQNS